VEVTDCQMFLSLGMHRGPLLAYLMADPELSLQKHPDHCHYYWALESLGICFWVATLQYPGWAGSTAPG